MGRKKANEIKEAEERLKRAPPPRKASYLLELGQAYKNNEDYEKAIEKFTEGALEAEKWNCYEDVSFNRRSIAEVHAQHGDEQACLVNLELFRNAAETWANPGHMQLYSHVAAWCHEQLFLRFGGDDRLWKAVKLCDESLAFLKKHEAEIDADSRAVLQGGNAAKRTASVHRMVSEIYALLNEQRRAEEHHKKAMAYAALKQDRELEYECLKGTKDWKWRKNVEETLRTLVEIAQKIRSPQGKQKLAQARIFLAEYLLSTRQWQKGEARLHELWSKDCTHLPQEDKDAIRRLIVYYYTSREREKFLRRSDINDKKKCETAERLGDTSADFEFYTSALEYYKMMLQHARSDEDKKAALRSLMETARDLNHWEDAVKYGERLLAIESKKGGEEECVDTENALFVIKTDGGLFASEQEMTQALEKLKQRSVQGVLQHVYQSCAKYYGKKNFPMQKQLFEDKAEAWISEHEGEEEKEEERTVTDQWDELEEDEIIREFERRMKEVEVDALKRKGRDKVNVTGETKLHIAAREEDSKEIAKLLDLGYAINHEDNAGWTPLHEAVTAGNVANARTLLMRGALRDPKSKEPILDDSTFYQECSAGVTPLMSACANGNEEMARMLKGMGCSVTATNDDGYTAVDFLTIYMIRNEHEEVEKGQREKLEKLKKELEAEQRKKGYPVRQGPPPNVRKSDFNTGSSARADLGKRSRKRHFDDAQLNLKAYTSTISTLRSGRKQRTREEQVLGIDVDEGEGEERGEGEATEDYDDEEETEAMNSSMLKRRKQRIHSDDDEEAVEVRTRLTGTTSRTSWGSGRNSFEEECKLFDVDDDRRLSTSSERKKSTTVKPMRRSEGGTTRRSKEKRQDEDFVVSDAEEIEHFPDYCRDEKRRSETPVLRARSPAFSTSSSLRRSNEWERRERWENEEERRVERATTTAAHLNRMSNEREWRSADEEEHRRMSIESNTSNRLFEASTTQSPFADVTNCLAHSPTVSSVSLNSPLSASSKILVRVEFGHVGCEVRWREPKILGVERDATLADLSKMLAAELEGKPHTYWCTQGALQGEMDSGLSLEMILVATQCAPAPVPILCRLTARTMVTEYAHHAGDVDDDILAALKRFEDEGVLELTKNTMDNERTEDALWKGLAMGRSNEKAPVERIQLENRVLNEDRLRLLGDYARKTSILNIRASKMDDDLVILLAKELSGSRSLHCLDLSFNDSLSSFSLCLLLKGLPALVEFTLSGVAEVQEPMELMKQLEGMPRLKRVILSHSEWLNDECANALLPATSKLTLVNLAGTCINSPNFFQLDWCAQLSSLSLAGCRMRTWTALCDWMRAAGEGKGGRGLTRVDVADTMAPVEIVEAAMASKRVITLDVSRCARIRAQELLLCFAKEPATHVKVKVEEATRKEMVAKKPLAERFLSK